jgi:hypothetical protein
MAHDQEVMGSNTGTVYWMDVSDASYYIKKMEIKVAKWGKPKIICKKKTFNLLIKLVSTKIFRRLKVANNAFATVELLKNVKHF